MNNQEHENPQRYIADDEIDLVQLFLILLKRKYLILSTFVVCIVLGAGFAFLKPTSYEYLTVIEIGTTIKNMEIGNIEAIESSAAVLEKVKAAYIPLNSQSEDSLIAKVSVSSPKNSKLIILKNVGSQQLEKEYSALHKKIADAVLDDHQTKLQSVQQQLLSQVARSKSDLDKIVLPELMQIKTKTLLENIVHKKRNLRALEDEENAHVLRSSIELDKLESKLLGTYDAQKIKINNLKNKASREEAVLAALKSQGSNLEKKKELLTQERNLLLTQIKEITEALDQIQKERWRAPTNVDSPANALTLMMVENQLGQYRTRKENLDFRIEVDLTQKNNNFDMLLADINRQIITQENVLAALVVEFEIQEKIHVREVTQAKNVIQQFKADELKLQSDYKRQREVKQSEINDTINRLSEYNIDHDFIVDNQKQRISELDAKLSNLQATKTLGVAVRSAKPVGTGKSLILALAGMLGLMGGIVMAFLAEFMSKVRQQQVG